MCVPSGSAVQHSAVRDAVPWLACSWHHVLVAVEGVGGLKTWEEGVCFLLPGLFGAFSFGARVRQGVAGWWCGLSLVVFSAFVAVPWRERPVKEERGKRKQGVVVGTTTKRGMHDARKRSPSVVAAGLAC